MGDTQAALTPQIEGVGKLAHHQEAPTYPDAPRAPGFEVAQAAK